MQPFLFFMCMCCYFFFLFACMWAHTSFFFSLFYANWKRAQRSGEERLKRTGESHMNKKRNLNLVKEDCPPSFVFTVTPSSIPGTQRWASQVALVVKNPPTSAGDIRCGFNPWVGKTPWRRVWQPTPVFLPGESPGMEEAGGLQSMGSQRIRYDKWLSSRRTIILL